MDSKNVLSQKRASLKLKMLAGFREITEVDVPEIPKERTLFPGTKNDYWYRIDMPNHSDCTCCIYELDVDGVFDPHFHRLNTEQTILLTPDAKIEVVSETRIYDVAFPNSCFFHKGEKHAVINKSGFKIELLVVWKPKMIGWNAEFVNKNEL